jgi:hypothetical protein
MDKEKAFALSGNIVIIGMIAIFVVTPLLQPYFPDTHEDWHYLIKLTQIDRGIKDGQYFVRWFPDLSAGYGYPVGNYYAPLIFYIAEVFHLLGFSFIISLKLTIVLITFLAGVFMYKLAAEFWGRSGGIISAVIYLCSPYHLVLLYVRGALTEYLALAFLPIILWSVYKLIKHKQIWYLMAFAASYALLILSHNITALIFSCFLGIYIIFLVIATHNTRLANRGYILGYNLMGGLLGLGLSAFFWLPALYERPLVQIQRLHQGYYDFHNHFVYISQLFSPSWGFGGSHPGPFDDMSFQIGVIPILLYMFSWGLVSKIERDERNTKLNFIFFLFMTIFIVYATTEYSAFIWERVPLIKYVQFPWRLLGLISFTVSFVCGSILLYLDKKFNVLETPFQMLLILIIVMAAYPYLRAHKYLIKPPAEQILNPDEIARTAATTDDGEYLPIGVKQVPAYTSEKVKIIAGNGTIEGVVLKSNMIKFRIKAMQDTSVKIAIFWFPGWSGYLDGKRVPIACDPETGLILMEIPKGEHRVRLKFEDTNIRMISKIISFISLGILAMSAIFFLGRVLCLRI